MLFSYIYTAMLLFSTIALALRGEGASLLLFQGADRAVSFCIELCGGICLWSAVLELMERCGLTARLSGLLRPVLCRLFPESARHEDVLAAISENVSANLLGLGNAATPAGIRAARGMARLSPGNRASDELCRFVVLNTASIQLIPSTIAALRASLGAAEPFDILPAVWLSSALSLACGLLAAELLRRLWP